MSDECNFRQADGGCAMGNRVEKCEENIKTAFGLIDKKAPYWVLLLLSTFFLSIAGAVHYQSQDIKDRVIVIETRIETTTKGGN